MQKLMQRTIWLDKSVRKNALDNREQNTDASGKQSEAGD